MKNILLSAAVAAVSAMLLTGCNLSENSGSSSSGTSSYAAGSSNPGGSSSGSVSSLDSNPGGGAAPLSGGHNPEPATMALMASGLAGYALIRKNKKNKK